MKNFFSVFIIILITGCTSHHARENNQVKKAHDATINKHDSSNYISINDAATILSKREIPILCYHRIQNSGKGDYVVSPAAFSEQMQALADSGYKTILPDQLYSYLANNAALPDKSIMLTFDDTGLEQFTIANEEMRKHNFKGVFFIMTISIGRKRYMSKEQIKQLADEGNYIEVHTWDHHKVTEYLDADWNKQLDESKQKLETITGKPVKYFAYPFGLWDEAATKELQKRGIKMAFQLSAQRDSLEPLFTVRRTLVPGTWTTSGLFKAMKRTFHY